MVPITTIGLVVRETKTGVRESRAFHIETIEGQGEGLMLENEVGGIAGPAGC